MVLLAVEWLCLCAAVIAYAFFLHRAGGMLCIYYRHAIGVCSLQIGSLCDYVVHSVCRTVAPGPRDSKARSRDETVADRICSYCIACVHGRVLVPALWK
ncbi:hypothetical protein BDY21DRAFT_338772 [Lineolata rhizophorae]|uniref:Uncharacterized protein n=1 Tax=Lineolata rhizophorae TaxID=578093 RepID=A0A6A6P6X6_9PEZI|nr:hypothetical protein BDY21DRAFT_338772 [Lineolata rhizophorae]